MGYFTDGKQNPGRISDIKTEVKRIRPVIRDDDNYGEGQPKRVMYYRNPGKGY